MVSEVSDVISLYVKFPLDVVEGHEQSSVE